jgi:hypothetical protein
MRSKFTVPHGAIALGVKALLIIPYDFNYISNPIAESGIRNK